MKPITDHVHYISFHIHMVECLFSTHTHTYAYSFVYSSHSLSFPKLIFGTFSSVNNRSKLTNLTDKIKMALNPGIKCMFEIRIFEHHFQLSLSTVQQLLLQLCMKPVIMYECSVQNCDNNFVKRRCWVLFYMLSLKVENTFPGPSHIIIMVFILAFIFVEH